MSVPRLLQGANWVSTFRNVWKNWKTKMLEHWGHFRVQVQRPRVTPEAVRAPAPGPMSRVLLVNADQLRIFSHLLTLIRTS